MLRAPKSQQALDARGIGDLISHKVGETFPWGTLFVNVTGSFIIGFLAALTGAQGRLSPESRVLTVQLFMTGICGGYTTFSSFSLQTLNLVRNGQWLYAGGNVLCSVALCMIAVWLGYLAGTTFNSMKSGS